MPDFKRHTTAYPGVCYILAKDGSKIFYLRYKRGGKSVEEKPGTPCATP